MIIRSSTLNTTRRTLPIRDAEQVRTLRSVDVDSFQPAPTAPLAVKQAAVTTPTKASGGGFFSRLWGSLKNVASGLLGQASGWVAQKAGGFITQAQSFVSNTVGTLLTKAVDWFQGLLAKWQGKLAQ